MMLRLLPALVLSIARKGKLSGEGFHVISNGLHLGLELCRLQRLLEVVQHLSRRTGVDLLGQLQAAIDELHYLDNVRLLEASRGERRSAQANAARIQGRLVAGNGVLIAGNGHLLEDALGTGAVQAKWTQVKRHEVVVRATGDNGVATGDQRLAQHPGVVHHLLLVLLELLAGGLLHSGGNAGDGVLMGATLQSGKDSKVDLLVVVVQRLHAILVHRLDALSVEDDGSSGAAQRLVRRRGDHIGVLKGRRRQASGYQTTDVGHVGHQNGAVLVGNGAEALVVQVARVAANAGNDQLRTKELGSELQLVVVNQTSRRADAIRHRLEEDRRGRDLLLVGLIAVG